MGSVTHWVNQLRAGDPQAAQPLWQRYFRRLVGLARKQLQGTPRRAADEEDVALSAFDSFCRGAEQGRFPRLTDRDDLWHLLVVITARKALRLAKHEGRQKRGGGKVVPESALTSADLAAEEPALAQVIGPEPMPEFAAQVAEECRRLLDCLGDDELRSIALGKKEGYTTEEIAARLGCAPRTAERKLGRIRGLWAEAVIGSAMGISEANGIGPPEAGTLEARLTAAPGPARFIPTHQGRGLPTAAIDALPTRSGSTKNPTYFALTPQSFIDFDWLVALDATTYNRGGPHAVTTGG